MGEKSCLVDDLRTAVYETRTYGGVRGAPHQLRLVGPSTRLFFFQISALKILAVATAMPAFFALIFEKITAIII